MGFQPTALPLSYANACDVAHLDSLRSTTDLRALFVDRQTCCLAFLIKRPRLPRFKRFVVFFFALAAFCFWALVLYQANRLVANNLPKHTPTSVKLENRFTTLRDGLTLIGDGVVEPSTTQARLKTRLFALVSLLYSGRITDRASLVTGAI